MAGLELDENNMRFMCVDIDLVSKPEEVAEMLEQEILLNDSGAMPEVAYHGQTRFVRRLTKKKDDPLDAELQNDVVATQGETTMEGAAVITGGLGGLGLLTAELLVQLGARHVVLASRSGKGEVV